MKEEFSKYFDTVKEIHFASGESSMQSSYYWMLDELIKRGRTDVEINLITNFSNFMYKQQNIFEKMCQFEKCNIFASIDCDGKYAEYIRNGTNWKTIESNRILLKNNFPKINFYLESTITNLNILRFPNFHKSWYNKGFVGIDKIRYNVLEKPNWFKLNFLPDDIKKEANEIWRNYFDWIYKNSKNYDNLPNKENPASIVYNISNYILSDYKIGLQGETYTEDKLKTEFNQYIKHFNELCYGDFFNIFPEFKDFKK
jgi:hypothetical protein